MDSFTLFFKVASNCAKLLVCSFGIFMVLNLLNNDPADITFLVLSLFFGVPITLFLCVFSIIRTVKKHKLERD